MRPPSYFRVLPDSALCDFHVSVSRLSTKIKVSDEEKRKDKLAALKEVRQRLTGEQTEDQGNDGHHNAQHNPENENCHHEPAPELEAVAER